MAADTDQARLPLRKALLAAGGHGDPRSHDPGLLLTLLTSVGVPLPEELLAVEDLTAFATVYCSDDLPLEEAPDPRAWPPLLRSLERLVSRAIEAAETPPPPPP
jgi:hypothetical protein